MELTDNLRTQCQDALESYLADRGESARHDAYVVGRQALDARIPLLELVSLLNARLAEVVGRAPTVPAAGRMASTAGEFLTECLSPYDMGLRAVREANDALRRQNELLEEEARRIAHEVHDSAAQLLVTVYTELHRMVREAPPEMQPRLERMRELLNGVEKDMRRIAHELRPTMLDDLGLMPALRALGENVAGRGGIKVSIEGRNEPRLPAPVEVVLYRVVQEALNNAVRHARASRADVKVERNGGNVLCSITDDGVGFAVPEKVREDAPRGLGLIGIRERLAVVGGHLRCEAGAGGRGARLTAVIPLGV